jgi:hypothetical protein
MINLFISHASEDKADFVEPLVEKLEADSDIKVWYDKYELTLGDRLRERIDQGLSQCDYGVVVLSHHFFAKSWPQQELDGLFSLEMKRGKVILPIRKGVTVEDLQKYSPMLASHFSVSADSGIPNVVLEIKKAIGLIARVKSIASGWEEKYLELSEDITHKRAAHALANSTEGVRRVCEAARSIIADAKARVEAMNQRPDSLEMKFTKSELDSLSIVGPYLGYSYSMQKSLQLSLRFHFHCEFTNSLEGCGLVFDIIRLGDYEQRTGRGRLELFKLTPQFDRECNVYWENLGRIFRDGRAVLDFAFDHFAEFMKNDAEKADYS